MNATNALKRIWASAPKNETFYEAVSLTHSRFSKAWHITNAQVAFAGNVGTAAAPAVVAFVPLPFAIKLPASDAGGAQQLELVITNAGKDMMAEIELASALPAERVQCEYRIFLSTDTRQSQILPIRLSVDAIVATSSAITAQAGRSDVLNQPFPAVFYRPEMFPGLER